VKVGVDTSALTETQWHQYALRFTLGGLVTVAAGVIAKLCGPVIGGVFLAFPAIFPAGVTLIARREREKKAKAGLNGTRRGHRVAALDSAGAVLGSVGLVGFAVCFWQGITHNAPATFIAAAFVWAGISLSLWWWRKRRRSH